MTERVTNVHGQARYVAGVPVGEVYMDLGVAGQKGYIKVEVFVDEEFPEHVTINVSSIEVSAPSQDVPRLRLRMDGATFADLPIDLGARRALTE